MRNIRAPILAGVFAVVGCAHVESPSDLSARSESDQRQAENDVRVYGGKAAESGQFPWMVFLISGTETKSRPCGGILVSSRWVLTAAHCVDRRGPKYTVGAADLVSINRDRIARPLRFTAAHCHEEYQGPQCSSEVSDDGGRRPSAHDLALLELDAASQALVSRLTPLQILSAERHPIEAGPNKVAFIAGWGATETASSSSRLLWAPVQLTSREACNAAPAHNGLITPDMICAGPAAGQSTGICFGDSGGPLFVQTTDGPRLAGVASWVVSDENRRCVLPGTFGVFARVSPDDAWLRRMLALN